MKEWMSKKYTARISVDTGDNNKSAVKVRYEVENMLNNKLGIDYLMQHCQTEFCAETLICILAIAKLRSHVPILLEHINQFYETFIKTYVLLQISSALSITFVHIIHLVHSCRCRSTNIYQSGF